MDEIINPTPWDDQWGVTANEWRDDCMDASLDMARQALGITPDMTVDQIARLLPPVGGLSVEDGAKVAKLLGMDARVETLNADVIYAHIRAGRRIIPLIASKDYPERIDKGIYQHFLVIIGNKADGSLVLNDPNRTYGSTFGPGVIMLMSEMIKALQDATDITGLHNQALVIYGALPVSTSSYPLGYDLSHHNAVDVSTLNSAFLLHKCTEGTYFTDPLYALRKGAFRGPFGAYHFGTGGDVQAQVKRFLAAVGVGVVLALDFEPNPDLSGTSEHSMTIGQAAQFVQAVHDQAGVWPMLYTRFNLIGTVMAQPLADVFKNCPLWIASQVSPPTLPGPWTTWTLQQFGQAQVGGVTVDQDRFNGTTAELQSFWSTYLVKSPAPTPVPTPPPTYMYTTTVVNLRSSASIPAPDPKANIIKTLSINTRVLVKVGSETTANGHTWLAVGTDNGQGGWIAKELLSENPTIPLPSPVPSKGMLYGPHFMAPQDNALIGKMPYQIYKGMGYSGADQVTSLQAAHLVHPSAVCIYRNYDLHRGSFVDFIGNDIPGAVSKWLNMMKDYLQAMPWAYFESFNEPDIRDPKFPAYLAFEAARTRALGLRGLKACVLNISAGTSSKALWLTAKDMIAATISTGSLIGVHCYAQTVMSADYHRSGWNSDHQWQGDVFPTAFDPDAAYTGLRCLTDARDIRAQGQGLARLAVTELGLDDMSGGVFGPAIKTKGWKTCVPVWQVQGWLQGTDPVSFYRKQLDWWSGVVAQEPMIVGGTVYTYRTADAQWDDFDVRDVL